MSHGCLLQTPYGDSLGTVLTALQQKRTAATLLPECLIKNAQHRSVPLQAAIVPGLVHIPLPLDRIKQLLNRTAVRLVQNICNLSNNNCNDVTIPSMLVLIAIPRQNNALQQHQLQEAVRQYLIDTEPHFANVTLGFLFGQQESLAALQRCPNWLQCPFRHIIFGGVDSLVNLKAVDRLAQHEPVRKLGEPEGKLVSEGAVFLHFSQDNFPTIDFCTPPKDAVSTYWITDRRLGPKDEQRWYQSIKSYVGFRDIIELNTQRWLGHLGAAHFPLQLALGLHWRDELMTAAISPKVHLFGELEGQSCHFATV